MFCNNCGKESTGSKKFCASCGSSILTNNDVTKQSILNQPYQSQQQCFQSSNAPILLVDPKRKRITQAIATLLSALLIITMLLGWVSVHIYIPQSNLPRELRGVIPSELTVTMTVFDFSNSVRIASGIFREAFTELERQRDLWGGSASELREIRDAVNSIRVASITTNVIKIIILLLIVSFLVFIVLMLSENRYSAFLGQLGSTVSLIIAIIFAIAIAVVNSKLNNLLDLPREFRDMLSISGSVWVYLTIIFSIFAMAFITVRKSIIRGE
ncbi:MAG: zinc ribbon domain-containing protein [Oscillospiraceae bacterium]|nr:zinc ribbon domain-containing protein [Oscillospiraceae bacterium]